MKYQLRDSDPIYDHISKFETFLVTMGFKRIEGAIYGFLALTSEPVTSDEICKALGLSQGAVSQGLNQLNSWGAAESSYDSQRGARVHIAVADSLKTVARVFQRREQGAMSSFKDMANDCIALCAQQGDPNDSRACADCAQ